MSHKLKAKDLVFKVAARSGLAQVQVDQVLKALGEVAAEELGAGNALTLPGIGTLSTRVRKGGQRKTFGKVIEVPDKTVPAMSFAKALKDSLAEG